MKPFEKLDRLDALIDELHIRNNTPADFIGTLYYVVDKKVHECFQDPERNRQIFIEYFFENASLTDLSREYNICVEQVRHIVTRITYWLTNSPIKRILCVGLQKYYEEKLTACRDKAYEDGYQAGLYESSSENTKRMMRLQKIHIDDVQMSCRLYNALYRAGLQNIAAIIEHGPKNIKRVRNLGTTSYQELVNILVNNFDEKLEDWT